MIDMDVVYLFLVVCHPFIVTTAVSMLAATVVVMVLDVFQVIRR
jgi:hypothetical protein